MRYKIVLFLAVVLSAPAAAEIYKYVAEDGSVVYTNEKPSPDAVPLELPGLTVVDTPRPAAAAASEQAAEDEGASPRSPYGAVSFASPQPDEHIQGTGNTVSVRLVAVRPLLPQHKLLLYLDDTRQGEFQNLAVDVQNVPRGEHQVRAEIVDSQGRVLGSAGPVTFHMRQHSRLHGNQPLVNPGGGNQ